MEKEEFRAQVRNGGHRWEWVVEYGSDRTRWSWVVGGQERRERTARRRAAKALKKARRQFEEETAWQTIT